MNIKEKIQKYKDNKKVLIDEQKKLVIESIKRDWTKEEIELYNMQYNTYAVSYGTNIQMTEFDIKLAYLRTNKNLFTKEEQEELLSLLCTKKDNNLNKRSRK